MAGVSFSFHSLWRVADVGASIPTRVNWVQMMVVEILWDRPKKSEALRLTGAPVNLAAPSLLFFGSPALPMLQDSLHLLQIIDPDSHFTTEIWTPAAMVCLPDAFYIRNDKNNIVILRLCQWGRQAGMKVQIYANNTSSDRLWGDSWKVSSYNDTFCNIPCANVF